MNIGYIPQACSTVQLFVATVDMYNNKIISIFNTIVIALMQILCCVPVQSSQPSPRSTVRCSFKGVYCPLCGFHLKVLCVTLLFSIPHQKAWLGIVNRGGQFPLNNKSFSIFDAIEKIVQPLLPNYMIVTSRHHYLIRFLAVILFSLTGCCFNMISKSLETGRVNNKPPCLISK